MFFSRAIIALSAISTLAIGAPATTAKSVTSTKTSSTATATPSLFSLKANVKPGAASQPWNGQFISQFHNGAAHGDLIVSGQSGLDFALNGTGRYYQLPEVGSNMPVVVTFEYINDADWFPVYFDGSLAAGSFPGFSIQTSGTTKHLISNQYGWIDWLVCSWWDNGLPQLFALSEPANLTALAAIKSCAMADLVVVSA